MIASIILYNQLLFFPQSLYAWQIFPLPSTPETSKLSKAPKIHFSKLPRDMKYRHPPIYSTSDLTRILSRCLPQVITVGIITGTRRGGKDAVIDFFIPGLSEESRITVLRGLFHQTDPPSQSLFPREPDGVKRCRKTGLLSSGSATRNYQIGAGPPSPP